MQNAPFLSTEIVIVLGIILVSVFLQIKVFKQNRKRIKKLGDIFNNSNTWGVYHGKDKNIAGITANGNKFLNLLVKDINQQLQTSRSSIVNRTVLKDTTENHCAAEVNEIHANTSLPIYYGLAGTMGGVIIGVVFMLAKVAWKSASIPSTEQGVANLLSILLLSLIPSLIGIALVLSNSNTLKTYKAKFEKGKNDFLLWLQTNLMPDLPTNINDAMQGVVANLNRFNTTFVENNQHLQQTFSKIESLSQTQGDVFRLINDVNMQEVATANISVLKDLRDCTDKLESLNNYLTAVKGYAQEIQLFRQQLAKEQDHLYILEEIRDFFRNHGYKDSLAKTITDSDDSLRTALRNLQETTANYMEMMSHTLTTQTDTFRSVSQEMEQTFETQLKRFPQIEKQMEQIAQIPLQLEKLAKEIESSNTRTANSINYALQNIRVELSGSNLPQTTKQPVWLIALLAVIALFTAMPYLVAIFKFLHNL